MIQEQESSSQPAATDTPADSLELSAPAGLERAESNETQPSDRQVPLGTSAAPAPFGPSYIAIVVIVLGAALIVIGRARAVGRGRSAAPERSFLPARQERSAMTGVQELRQLVADADELTVRLADAADTRTAELEKLIARADERIARLERAMAVLGAHVAEDVPLSAPSNSGARHAAGSIQALTPPADPDVEAEFRREVFTLADEGCGALEIARRVGRPQGQVELMLGLRRAAGAGNPRAASG